MRLLYICCLVGLPDRQTKRLRYAELSIVPLDEGVSDYASSLRKRGHWQRMVWSVAVYRMIGKISLAKVSEKYKKRKDNLQREGLESCHTCPRQPEALKGGGHCAACKRDAQ